MAAEVRVLTARQTREILDIRRAVEIVEETFRWLASGQVVWSDPPVMGLRVPEPKAAYRLKGAYLPALGVVGFRVTGFPLDEAGTGSGAADNTRFVILSDPATGHPLAILDEHWTYSVRTVAAAVVAAKYLADPESSRLGLVGAGQLAGIGLEALLQVFPIKEARVFSRRPESRRGFAGRMSEITGIRVRAVDSAEEAVRDAPLILACTSAGRPIVQAAWVPRDAFLCTLGRDELEPECYAQADKIVFDSWELSQESSDVRKLVQAGVLSRERLHAEIADLVVGRARGREGPERVVVRAEGMANQDVAVCAWTYKEAARRGVGVVLPVG
jgi:ornithine cyclodeaminase/alanine dehydrogenase-like protein (mu-crystallin family)